jgi:putative flippase GtrA
MSPPPQRATGQQVLSFLLVGSMATIIQYTMLVLLVEMLGWRAATASAIGFATSAVFNYALNRRLTFRSHTEHTVGAPRFAVVAGIGLGINWGAMLLLTETLRTHYVLAQVLATAITLVWNFCGNKWWTFRDEKTPVAERQHT